MDIREKIKEIRPVQLIIPLIIFIIFIGAIIGIINYQNKTKLKTPPKLEITSPADGATVTEAQVIVVGKTSSKNKILVNNKEAKVDIKGSFNKETPLSVGDNTIVVIAENSLGTKNEKSIKVKRKESANTNNTTDQSNVTPDVQPAATPAQTTVAPAGDGKGNLSTSGPETFWLLESASLSAAGAAWFATRKKLKKVLKNN